MKILMIGRGVIATQYGWALETAGHKVDFYVRPGRSTQYSSSVKLEIRDGRKKLNGTPINLEWPITMREDLDPTHDYELIIVSVNHHQLDEVTTFLSSRIHKATVLIFTNLWIEPQDAIALLPKDQVIWGFPGGGGGFHNTNTLQGGFMKSIFLESAQETASPTRHQAVRSLFQSAGFKISETKDFRSWLWFHFMLNAAMAPIALKFGSYSHVFDSTTAIKETLLLLREMLPLLPAKGGKVGPATLLALHLPTGPSAAIIRLIMQRGSLPREIMEPASTTGHTSYSLISPFPRDLLASAKQHNIPLPRLTALEPLFNNHPTTIPQPRR